MSETTKVQFWTSEGEDIEQFTRQLGDYHCALVAKEQSLAGTTWLVTIEGAFDDIKAFYCARTGVEQFPDWEIDLQGDDQVCVLIDDDDDDSEPTEKPKAKASPKPKASPRFPDATEIVLGLIREFGPCQVGVVRANWASRDKAFAQLADRARKGVIRRAIRKLEAQGSVSKEGHAYSLAKAAKAKRTKPSKPKAQPAAA